MANPARPGQKEVQVIIITLAVMAISFGGIQLLRTRIGKQSGAQSIENALSRESQSGFRRAEATLRMGKFETKLSMDFYAECAGKSEGRLRGYFLSHPCEGLARAYIQIGNINRELILVAISWVEMASVTSAEEYKQLVDADVGNIIELPRETKSLKSIAYEYRTYTSGIKGTFVWQVEVKPAFSAASDAVVNDILEKSRQ